MIIEKGVGKYEKILGELYLGNIIPNESLKMTQTELELSEEIDAQIKHISSALGESEKKEFMKLIDKIYTSEASYCPYIFSVGFKLGVRIIMECLLDEK